MLSSDSILKFIKMLFLKTLWRIKIDYQEQMMREKLALESLHITFEVTKSQKVSNKVC